MVETRPRSCEGGQRLSGSREAGTNVQFAELKWIGSSNWCAVLEAGGCGLDIVLLTTWPGGYCDAVAMRTVRA